MSEPTSHVAERIGRLIDVAARIKAGQALPGQETEGLLESGFGELIALEAKLQRDSGHRSGSLSGGATAERGEADATETLRSIEALREALSELQYASEEAGTRRVGYGFVLPAQDRSDMAESRSRSLDPRSTG